MADEHGAESAVGRASGIAGPGLGGEVEAQVDGVLEVLDVDGGGCGVVEGAGFVGWVGEDVGWDGRWVELGVEPVWCGVEGALEFY